jgi:hypothetical protein
MIRFGKSDSSVWEIGWSDLKNHTIQFGVCCELVLTSVLVSTFSPRTLLSLLPPPLDPSLCRSSLCRRQPKLRSVALATP